MIVEISESGPLIPLGSANGFVRGVGGKDDRCCGVCVDGMLYPPRLALEEDGVRPGTASKKSVLDDDGEPKDESNPRFA
jgi:hypothetical protein